MGVKVNTYVMWGALLPYEPFKGKYDDLEPYMDDPRGNIADAKAGVKVLYDGMNGKYVAIGRIVERTGSHGDFHEPVKGLKRPNDWLEISDQIREVMRAADYSSANAAHEALGEWLIISHYR